MGSRTIQWCDHCGGVRRLTRLLYGKPSDWPGIGSASPSTYKEVVLCGECLDVALKMLNKRSAETGR